MNRTIISKKDLVDISDDEHAIDEIVESDEVQTHITTPSNADKYSDRLLKYIPSEIIVLYLSLDTTIRSAGKTDALLYWFIFIAGAVFTYLYLYRVQKVKKQVQLILSVVAFCIWVFAIGGPFSYLSWYDPIYGGILLPIFTFAIPIIET
jgi:hypothetical protein